MKKLTDEITATEDGLIIEYNTFLIEGLCSIMKDWKYIEKNNSLVPMFSWNEIVEFLTWHEGEPYCYNLDDNEVYCGIAKKIYNQDFKKIILHKNALLFCNDAEGFHFLFSKVKGKS